MLTQHVPTSEINTTTHKVSSNNDTLLVDTPYTLIYNNLPPITLYAIPQSITQLVHGYVWHNHQNAAALNITYNDTTIHITSTDQAQPKITYKTIPENLLTYTNLIQWSHAFKHHQPLYKKTQATTCVGTFTNKNEPFVIECSSFNTALYKLTGKLLTSPPESFFPTLFVSTVLSQYHTNYCIALSPDIIVSTSAITSSAIHALSNTPIRLFGMAESPSLRGYLNATF